MYLFVYGTLQRGWGNNRYLHNAEFVARGYTKDRYVLQDCGFPYAVPEKFAPPHVPALFVDGEVWSITDDHLRGCDALEGYNNPNDYWYNRQVRKVVIPSMDNTEINSFIYEMEEFKPTLPICKRVECAEFDVYKWGE